MPNGLLQYAAVTWPATEPNKAFTKKDIETMLNIRLKLKEIKRRVSAEDTFRKNCEVLPPPGKV